MKSSPLEMIFSIMSIVDAIALLHVPFRNLSKEVIARCQYMTTTLSDDFPQSIIS